MYVIKRDGHKEPVSFDKITDRIKKLCYGLNDLVDAVKVAMRVIEGLYDGVTTSELDNLAAETAASMTIAHPDYAQLAARIAISNLHKNTNKSFSETMNEMYHYVNPRTNQSAPLLSEEVHKAIERSVRRAREGDGPTFLEIKTYRFRGHSMSDPAKYRTKEELEEYKEKDPINTVLKTIMDNNWATEQEITNINDKVKADVEASVQFAEESPYPDDNELYKDVYTDEHYPFIVD